MDSTAVAAAWTNARRHGRYLGGGSYGVVYYDPASQRALKKVGGRSSYSRSHDAGVGTLELHERPHYSAVRELDVLTCCEHPNVVKVCGWCIDDDGGIVFAMPRYQGSLRALANKLSVAQRLAILPSLACQVASGVAALHACYRLHKDIKLCNVFYSTRPPTSPAEASVAIDGEFYSFVVGDAGLGRPHTIEEAATSYMFSPSYRPPEVWLGQPGAETADAWSIAQTLHDFAINCPEYIVRKARMSYTKLFERVVDDDMSFEDAQAAVEDASDSDSDSDSSSDGSGSESPSDEDDSGSSGSSSDEDSDVSGSSSDSSESDDGEDEVEIRSVLTTIKELYGLNVPRKSVFWDEVPRLPPWVPHGSPAAALQRTEERRLEGLKWPKPLFKIMAAALHSLPSQRIDVATMADRLRSAYPPLMCRVTTLTPPPCVCTTPFSKHRRQQLIDEIENVVAESGLLADWAVTAISLIDKAGPSLDGPHLGRAALLLSHRVLYGCGTVDGMEDEVSEEVAQQCVHLYRAVGPTLYHPFFHTAVEFNPENSEEQRAARSVVSQLRREPLRAPAGKLARVSVKQRARGGRRK